MALPVTDLIALPGIAGNISQNRIEEFEQMKADARDWELEKLAERLGLPEGWFGSAQEQDETALSRAISEAALQVGEAVQELQRAAVEQPGKSGGEDHPPRAGGASGG